MMARTVRDYVEVRSFTSLDQLIVALTAVRDGLPAGAEAQAILRGDDHFGRHIAISYQRPLTAQELDCERRYGGIAGEDVAPLGVAA